jgi:hypothetical protein
MSQLEDSVVEQSGPSTGRVAAAPVVETQAQVYGVVASFNTPEELLDAVRALRERGYDKLETYTPFPVHGLDEALGIRRSRLGWIVAAMGLLGFLTGLLLQWWVGTDANRFVIGGKPFFALQPSVPIMFELTVLFSAFGAVFGMLFLNGLPRLYHPVFEHAQARRISDDRFLLAVEAGNEEFDAGRVMKAVAAAGGEEAEVIAA